MNKIGQQAARSSSHAPGGAKSHPQNSNQINGRVIELISAKLGYDPHDVEYQVRKDLLFSENKDRNSAYNTNNMNNQASFVGNLYLRLLDEEDEHNNKLRYDQQMIQDQQQRAKSNASPSEK